MQLIEADETTSQEFPSEEIVIERILEVLLAEIKEDGPPVKGEIIMVPQDPNKKH